MTLLSAHFASCCWVTVFPLPNGPGIAAVPPLATGKKVSNTRCPVSNGDSGGNFLKTGLGVLTIHQLDNPTGDFPFVVFISATFSFTVYLPSLISDNLPLTQKAPLFYD
jgi:hypothetical protein